MAFTNTDKIQCSKDVWTQVTTADNVIHFNIPWNVKCYYIESSTNPNTLYSTPNVDTQPITLLSDGRNSSRDSYILRSYTASIGPLWIYPVNTDVSCQVGV